MKVAPCQQKPVSQREGTTHPQAVLGNSTGDFELHYWDISSENTQKQMFCSWNGTLFVCVLTPEAEEVKAVHWKVIRSKHKSHVLHLIQKENTEVLSVKLKIKSSCWHSCVDPTQTSFNTQSRRFTSLHTEAAPLIKLKPNGPFYTPKVNIRHSDVMKLAVSYHKAKSGGLCLK